MPAGFSILSLVWNFITGNWSAIVKTVLDWHKSNLDAQATHEKTEADLASKDFELQAKEREINARETIQGGWLIQGPMAVIAWSVALYYFKLLAIDKVASRPVYYFVGCIQRPESLCPTLDRLFSTDPLSADLTSVALGVVAYYFGRAMIGAAQSVGTSLANAIRSKR